MFYKTCRFFRFLRLWGNLEFFFYRTNSRELCDISQFPYNCFYKIPRPILVACISTLRTLSDQLRDGIWCQFLVAFHHLQFLSSFQHLRIWFLHLVRVAHDRWLPPNYLCFISSVRDFLCKQFLDNLWNNGDIVTESRVLIGSITSKYCWICCLIIPVW